MHNIVKDWLAGYPASVERDTMPDLDYEGRYIDRPLRSFVVYSGICDRPWKFPIAYIDGDGMVS
jgi:hypothetical protein